ncbi:hypothetical protein Cgig2_020954 [Carnegiea gigantea]|uniref:Uncharacterized protein n=1 Tax=Carnegiea gigantea TaxID=171969 RepID=A0A9Q1JLU8_9CARY|nr:hypothetical protein Cgig2_020954 [Carnegiea gigantea]
MAGEEREGGPIHSGQLTGLAAAGNGQRKLGFTNGSRSMRCNPPRLRLSPRQGQLTVPSSPQGSGKLSILWPRPSDPIYCDWPPHPSETGPTQVDLLPGQPIANARAQNSDPFKAEESKSQLTFLCRMPSSNVHTLVAGMPGPKQTHPLAAAFPDKVPDASQEHTTPKNKTTESGSGTQALGKSSLSKYRSLIEIPIKTYQYTNPGP